MTVPLAAETTVKKMVIRPPPVMDNETFIKKLLKEVEKMPTTFTAGVTSGKMPKKASGKTIWKNASKALKRHRKRVADGRSRPTSVKSANQRRNSQKAKATRNHYIKRGKWLLDDKEDGP